MGHCFYCSSFFFEILRVFLGESDLGGGAPVAESQLYFINFEKLSKLSNKFEVAIP